MDRKLILKQRFNNPFIDHKWFDIVEQSGDPECFDRFCQEKVAPKKKNKPPVF
jgi:hypothetical protein